MPKIPTASSAPTTTTSRPRTAIRFDIRDEEPLPLPRIRSISYIDSVEILRRGYFRTEFLKFMGNNCGRIYPPKTTAIPGGGFFTKMWLHQPNAKAVAYLEGKGCGITRVQVALDLMPGRTTTARSLQAYIARTYVPNPAPDHPIVCFSGQNGRSEGVLDGSTAYFRFKNPQRPGKTCALYADFLSKVEGVPCCHLEVRVNLNKYLTSYGLATPHDLLHLNHSKFWERRLVLKEAPTAEQLGAAWIKAKMSDRQGGGRHLPYSDLFGMSRRDYSQLRVGEMLRRVAQDGNGNVCTYDFLCYLRDHRPLGTAPVGHLFKALDSSWLLPPAHNGLWGPRPLINQQVTGDNKGCIPLSWLSEGDIPY